MTKMTNKPVASRIRQASKTIPNAMRNEDATTRSADLWIRRQMEVDLWNTTYVGVKDKFGNPVSEYNNLQLDNLNLVVQMFMENPVKAVIEQDGERMIIPGISQIDGRKRNTDAPNWIDTPFPLIDKGIIVAVSPWLQAHYYELKEKMGRFNPELAEKLVAPEVGDMILTNHFMFKETRFYYDKQAKCNDFVRNQEEIRLDNFSYMFKISNYDIEAIIKKDSPLFKAHAHVSPLNKFVEDSSKSK
jgi:hypothetical protein